MPGRTSSRIDWDLRQRREQRSTRERLTPDAARGAKAKAMRLDGQPRAHDVARGAEVEVAYGRSDAAWIDAERTRCADVEVLILDARITSASAPLWAM